MRELGERRAELLEALELPVSLETPLTEWLGSVDDLLELCDTVATARQTPDDLADIEQLLQEDATLGDFAAGVTVTHHVAVTTYHSSKGREFDTVLLPGLQEGLMPRGGINVVLAEQRRHFYVALTRAKRRVHMLSAPSCTWCAYNKIRRGADSRFVAEVRARLEH